MHVLMSDDHIISKVDDDSNILITAKIVDNIVSLANKPELEYQLINAKQSKMWVQGQR